MSTKSFYFLVICLILLSLIVSAENPGDIRLQGFVNDYAQVLSSQEETVISNTLKPFYDSGRAQFAVVTVNSLDGRDIESFALEVAQGKLGEEDENNGLLLLIAVQDRKYRFEVGRSLEPYLNDAKIGRIGRQILVPAFQGEDYAGGIQAAVLEVAKELDVEITSTPIPLKRANNSGLLRLLFPFIFFIIIFVSAFRSRSIHGKRKGNDFFFAALLAASMMRGGRGGLGGAGFGGFGGGGFGGGGASGGW
ncbi:MAG: TPM domain-containing protein [Nanoarchaeota archaeon]|nr:TPM domain-containing protein [DPANN group archaeon]MBL7116878.1 TPM domain-containing protein [Nanoarchaeota archaeon]